MHLDVSVLVLVCLTCVLMHLILILHLYKSHLAI